MVHGLCATRTPSLRHSGDREYNRISPPRPSASLPVVSAGTWELGAVMGAAPARAARHATYCHAPLLHAAAGYYAGLFLIVHYVCT
jgi:hypothetical protein